MIEDDDDLLRLHQHVFTAAGATVYAASSAADALDLARAHPIDVIVSDIGLPAVDGLSLLRVLRQLKPELAQVPAIAVTGLAEHADINEAFLAGFDAYATKPVDEQSLLRLATQLVRRGRGADDRAA